MPEMALEKLEVVRKLAAEFANTNGWTLGHLLGSGGSAAVYLATADDTMFAVKVYDPTFFDEKDGAAEKHRIELQRQLIGHQCPTLVKLLQIKFSNNTCFIMMEFVPGMELSKCLSEVPRAMIWPLIQQLVDAVKFLELNRLVHRDIKPHNIIVSADFKHLTLIDLGVVRDFSNIDREGTDHGKRLPFIATAQYSSPEYLFRLEQPDPLLWQGLSYYQVGGVLHDLIMRRPLFADEVASENRYVVAMAVLKKIPILNCEGDVDPDLKALAAKCLDKDLKRRTQFVRWDDFHPRGAEPAKELARRLELLNGARIGTAAIELERSRQELARHQSLEHLLTEVNAEVKDSFAGTYCERISVGAPQHTGLLRFRLPQLKIAIDVTVTVKWTPDQDNDVASVCVAAAMKADTSDAVFVPGAGEVALLYSNGTNFEITLEALKDVFIRLVTQALDLFDRDGFPSESVSLSLD